MAVKVYIILNTMILFAVLLWFGFYHFRRSVHQEKEALFMQYAKYGNLVLDKDLQDVPPILQKYLIKAGVIGKNINGTATFQQQGQIKTGPTKRWTSFRATQYMTAKVPNFIWSARSYPLFIRDQSIEGKGEVKLNLFGLKNIGKSEGFKTDESALARCLAELIFYPVAFLTTHISWKVLDKNLLKASLRLNNIQTEGIFHFDEEGLVERFEAKRYMDETLTDFTGIVDDYKIMDGLFIPTSMKAIWHLKEGDFEYFNSTITDYHIE